MIRGTKGRQARKIAEELFSDFPQGSVALEMLDDDDLAKIFEQVQADAPPGGRKVYHAPGQMRAYAETGSKSLYPASRIKRHRATASEMEERARFLIAYAREHQPVTVRGLYYQAEVAGVRAVLSDRRPTCLCGRPA